MLDLEQYQIRGSTAREIASSVEASIREGLLRGGDRLPTVRALAERLGTSPATVNSGYRILRERGLVIAGGRRGTHVAPRPPVLALETLPDGLLAASPPPGVPRAQSPLGSAMDGERMAALRRLLEPYPDVLLIEDDHAGLVAGAPFSTIVAATSRRWAVIRSTSKVLHPDMRLAFTAGDETTIARVEGRQALGPRWVSHVLQAIVFQLMADPGFEATARRAAEVYRARREALISALADRDVPAYGRSGLNVWIPVREEIRAVGALL